MFLAERNCGNSNRLFSCIYSAFQFYEELYFIKKKGWEIFFFNILNAFSLQFKKKLFLEINFTLKISEIDGSNDGFNSTFLAFITNLPANFNVSNPDLYINIIHCAIFNQLMLIQSENQFKQKKEMANKKMK